MEKKIITSKVPKYISNDCKNKKELLNNDLLNE